MSGTSILPAIPTYLSISATESTRITKFESTDLQTKSDIAYLTKQAPKLTSADALLKDYRSLSIVLNAFGIGSHVQDTALLRQLMTQDPTSKTSTAYKMADPALTRFATAMGQFTVSPFSSQAGVTAVATAESTNNYEAAQDTLSPGIADALYFKRKIAGLTTVPELMSDPKLLAVATVATNMPDQFGTLDYTAQVNLLSAKIDMTKFSDPSYVDKFVGKYLAINTANNATTTDTTGALTILTGGGSSDNVLGTLFSNTTASTSDAGLLSLFA